VKIEKPAPQAASASAAPQAASAVPVAEKR
jgi:hypothetical protein